MRGLGELQLGFRGELTMSEQMEELAEALHRETLPLWWVKLGFPSTRPLRSWLGNLKDRCGQLEDWIADPLSVPRVVDVARLFSPQSFLTAIKQVCCQQQHLELDKLQVLTEVSKRDVRQVDAAAKEGAFVTGMYLEGARWDVNSQSLEDSRPKEMFTRMPVINCKAGLVQDKEDRSVYLCPTYCVPTRRPYFVFAAPLRSRQSEKSAPPHGSSHTLGGPRHALLSRIPRASPFEVMREGTPLREIAIDSAHAGRALLVSGWWHAKTSGAFRGTAGVISRCESLTNAEVRAHVANAPVRTLRALHASRNVPRRGPSNRRRSGSWPAWP